MGKFPFCIFFEVDADAISILGVMHGSRAPNAWKVRV